MAHTSCEATSAHAHVHAHAPRHPQARTHESTYTGKYIILISFLRHKLFAKAPQCCLIRTLPVFFDCYKRISYCLNVADWPLIILYRVNDILSVYDKVLRNPCWKGLLALVVTSWAFCPKLMPTILLMHDLSNGMHTMLSSACSGCWIVYQ